MDRPPARENDQTMFLNRVRELILSGELAAGQRVRRSAR